MANPFTRGRVWACHTCHTRVDGHARHCPSCVRRNPTQLRGLELMSAKTALGCLILVVAVYVLVPLAIALLSALIALVT